MQPVADMGQLFPFACRCCSYVAGRSFWLISSKQSSRASFHCPFSSSCACGWHKKSRGKTQGQLAMQTNAKREIQRDKKKSAERNTIKGTPLGEPPDRCQHIASGPFIAQANCWTLLGAVCYRQQRPLMQKKKKKGIQQNDLEALSSPTRASAK